MLFNVSVFNFERRFVTLMFCFCCCVVTLLLLLLDMCREAPQTVIELEHYGVPFSRTDEGKVRCFVVERFNCLLLNCGVVISDLSACIWWSIDQVW
jgi:hypothetical protein